MRREIGRERDRERERSREREVERERVCVCVCVSCRVPITQTQAHTSFSADLRKFTSLFLSATVPPTPSFLLSCFGDVARKLPPPPPLESEYDRRFKWQRPASPSRGTRAAAGKAEVSPSPAKQVHIDPRPAVISPVHGKQHGEFVASHEFATSRPLPLMLLPEDQVKGLVWTGANRMHCACEGFGVFAFGLYSEGATAPRNTAVHRLTDKQKHRHTHTDTHTHTQKQKHRHTHTHTETETQIHTETEAQTKIHMVHIHWHLHLPTAGEDIHGTTCIRGPHSIQRCCGSANGLGVGV